jgi:hypothetical protein
MPAGGILAASPVFQGASMFRSSILVLALAVAGCSPGPAPPGVHAPSPCASDEASYACQVERYHNVSAP